LTGSPPKEPSGGTVLKASPTIQTFQSAWAQCAAVRAVGTVLIRMPACTSEAAKWSVASTTTPDQPTSWSRLHAWGRSAGASVKAGGAGPAIRSRIVAVRMPSKLSHPGQPGHDDLVPGADVE